MSSYRNQRLTCKGHHTSTMVCIVLHPPNSMLRTNHPSIAADNTFPKSLRNPSNSAKGSDHCHSSDYMKQQWETESYAAAHTDRISHRNPIIISDCNLRTLYQSGNSHQLSMTTQDLLHYASTETADMDEKEKNSTTCSTPIHPTTSSVTRFILLEDSSTQKVPKTVTKKLQEQWVPARLLHDTTTNNNG